MFLIQCILLISPLSRVKDGNLIRSYLFLRTIACAFPFEYIFHFDIEGIEVVCDRILDKLTKERMSKVILKKFENKMNSVHLKI